MNCPDRYEQPKRPPAEPTGAPRDLAVQLLQPGQECPELAVQVP